MGFSGFHAQVGFGLKPFMVVSFAAFVAAISLRRTPMMRPFEVLFIVFALAFAATTVYATDTRSAIRLDIGIALMVAFYFAWRTLFHRISRARFERALEFAARGVIFFALGYYALGMLEIHGRFTQFNGRLVDGVLVDRTIPRLVGGIGDPNIFVFTITWAVFFFLARYRQRPFFTAVSFVALLLTLSKGGIFGVAIGFAVYILVNWRRQRSVRRLSAVAPPMLALLVLISALTVGNIDSVVQRRLEASNFSSGRIRIWAHALDIYRQHPLTGVGIYSFRALEKKDFSIAKYMHNTYFEVLVEGGIVPFALYVAFQIALLVEVVRVRRRAPWLLPTVVAMQIQMFGLSLLINESLFLMMATVFVYKRGAQHRTEPLRAGVPDQSGPTANPSAADSIP